MRLKILNESYIRNEAARIFPTCSANGETTEIFDSDIVQSPGALFKHIAAALGLTNFKFMDGCFLQTQFDPDMDANFFLRLYPRGTIIYVNPPFKDPAMFIMRAYILFAYFGMNVVLLKLSQKFEKLEFAKTFIAPVAIKVPLYKMPFRGYPDGQKSLVGLSLYFLLQPDMMDFVHYKSNNEDWEKYIETTDNEL